MMRRSGVFLLGLALLRIAVAPAGALPLSAEQMDTICTKLASMGWTIADMRDQGMSRFAVKHRIEEHPFLSEISGTEKKEILFFLYTVVDVAFTSPRMQARVFELSVKRDCLIGLLRRPEVQKDAW